MSNSTDESDYKPPNFCPSCGKKVTREGARFCSKCGHNFSGKTNARSREVESEPSTQQDKEGGHPPSYIPQNQQVQKSPVNQSGYGSSSSQQQSFGYGAPQTRRGNFITPSQIPSVDAPLFNNEEYKIIGIFIFITWFSHILRYLLLFNRFPTFLNIVIPIPLYVIGIFFIFTIQKYLMREKGVQVILNSNRFDFTKSLVFSSFLLTLIPSRNLIDHDDSYIPDEVSIPTSGQGGMGYQEIPKSQYIGKNVRPRMYMIKNFAIAVFSLLFLLAYFRYDEPALSTSLRLFTAFLAGFVIVDIGPIFGRHYKESSNYGRIRTLLIFIIGLGITLSALLGESFFTALANR